MTIPIDTRDYEKTFGAHPMGRRFWSFRIVCNASVQSFRTQTPVTYATACARRGKHHRERQLIRFLSTGPLFWTPAPELAYGPLARSQ